MQQHDLLIGFEVFHVHLGGSVRIERDQPWEIRPLVNLPDRPDGERHTAIRKKQRLCFVTHSWYQGGGRQQFALSEFSFLQAEFAE